MCTKMSSIRQNCHLRSYYYVHLLIFEYLSRAQKIMLVRVKTRRFYFIRKFCFSLLMYQYISNISNIYNPEENLTLAYQTICDHTFSNLKLYHTFHLIWLNTWLVFCFFSYVKIIRLLWRKGGVGIHCKLIHDWVELTGAIIFFLTQYITKFEILIGELLRK